MNAPETFEEKAPPEGPAIAETPQGPPRGVATMAIVRWVLVLLTALVATGSILSFAGVHFGSVTSASSGQVYYCPMHPSVVEDHPGECPICRLTLVEKSAGGRKPGGVNAPIGGPTDGGMAIEAKGDGGVPGLVPVELSPERIQLLGMRTGRATR